LAWPANYVMEFQRDDGLTFKTGPIAVDPLRVLATGETITTPAVHLGYVRRDFDAAVQAMHTHIRRSVSPQRDPDHAYRIQYIIPEDQGPSLYHGSDFNEENLKKCIDVAAAVGIETFILDFGWAESAGKWFPSGLDPLRNYAHKKGLLFGLYSEIEGGRGEWNKTEAFIKNPKWFAGYILNIAIPEAAAWMESEWIGIAERLKVDLFRHDQNAVMRHEGTVSMQHGFPENDYWRHYEAFYAMTDRIRATYPNMVLQQAASGGCRLDLATIGHWDEHFASDRTFNPWIYQMASGMSVFLPPEILVSPHGMMGDQTGKYIEHPDLVTMLRGAYAMGNTPMIFNAMLPKSLEELKPEVQETFLHYANLYKTFIRPMLATCEVWHIAPVNAIGGVETGDWFAMEFTSPDKKQAWATVIRLSQTRGKSMNLSWHLPLQLRRPAAPDAYLLKPKGLNAEMNYHVTFDNTGKVETHSGAKLMAEGLLIRTPANPCSELLLFEEAKE